jgi:antitoxin ParD1/3/4
MNVNLTPELERFVQQKVETGRYNSASEVVREALRLLEQKEQLRQLQILELRKRIAEGLTSLDRGEAVDGEQFLDELEGGLDDLEGHRKAG